jgi:DNA-3-methyladenine glycosylase II
MEAALRHLRRRDPVLKQIIAQVGPYAIEYHPPTFHTLVRSIIYQQLSGKAASTICGRFEQLCGVRRLTPTAVLALTPEQMRAAGLSTRKSAYIRDLADKTASGQVRFGRHRRMSDDDIIAELTQVRGIGVWTVQMFLMFALARPDVFPVLDLGVRNAMRKLYPLPANPKPADFETIADLWRPYRSVASWYMWRSLEL